ncbi:hypothetical protein B0I35DRAFT_473041 [Stachybotrys elegans]|uniref:Uncharacterized protein n=1 Tax=Stachybotrys elegans TaxID=80388 RepID=A0A8K0T6K4_9HYPO|nr:hypothetical protein B0I35DRAFT_473041 [Stachybotrys elegans]
MACDCEAKGLENAIKQAEDRMMKNIYSEIRIWVRAHAQDYILEYFRLLTERRKTAHSAHLDQLNAHAYYHYHAPPHPTQLAEAQASLKRGIDEDWQASVQRYPEVLDYYFSLVDMTLPADDDPAVKDPPLAAITNHRKAHRRSGTGGAAAMAPAMTGPPVPHPIAAAPYDREIAYPRTPPPPTLERMERRTPGPRDRRSGGYRPSMAHPPPPASGYYAPYG